MDESGRLEGGTAGNALMGMLMLLQWDGSGRLDSWTTGNALPGMPLLLPCGNNQACAQLEQLGTGWQDHSGET